MQYLKRYEVENMLFYPNWESRYEIGSGINSAITLRRRNISETHGSFRVLFRMHRK